MRRIHAVLMALAAVVLLVAARPASEFDLLTRLNGQPYRWIQPDGGRSGLYAASGTGCTIFTGSTTQRGASFTPTVVMLVPDVPLNLCIQPVQTPDGVTQPWDSGCSTLPTNENFGVSLQPLVPFYFVPQAGVQRVCAASDAGIVSGALYDMR